jgi:hypothetical protein
VSSFCIESSPAVAPGCRSSGAGLMPSEEPTGFAPPLTTAGLPPNAPARLSLSSLNFSVSTVDIANRTMNSTISSVIMSA